MSLPYTTQELVARAYEMLSQREKKKNVFIQPDVLVRDRKTFIANFESFCVSLNREKNIVKQYIDKETEIASSLITDNTQLKIDTSLKPPHVRSILANFIKNHVLCSQCKSSSTQIIKINRIQFIECNTCHSKKNFSL